MSLGRTSVVPELDNAPATAVPRVGPRETPKDASRRWRQQRRVGPGPQEPAAPPRSHTAADMATDVVTGELQAYLLASSRRRPPSTSSASTGVSRHHIDRRVRDATHNANAEYRITLIGVDPPWWTRCFKRLSVVRSRWGFDGRAGVECDSGCRSLRCSRRVQSEARLGSARLWCCGSRRVRV
jgi:hypothetical protein